MRLLVALAFLSLPMFPSWGCATAMTADAKPAVPEKVRKKFGPAVDVLAGATKVEVFRVNWRKKGADEKKIGPFYITATAKDQDQKFAARLAGVLLDDTSFAWDIAKGCIFQPGVAYKVWKGDEAVVVAICFSCDEVWVAPVDKEGKVGEGRIAESDPSRSALLKLAKESLPDDAEIQKLTDKR